MSSNDIRPPATTMAHGLRLLIVDERRGGNGDATSDPTDRIASGLPFAARCRDWEEARETADSRERMSQRRGSSALFADMLN